MVPAPNKTKVYGSFAGPFSFGVATGIAFALETSVIRSQPQVSYISPQTVNLALKKRLFDQIN